LKVGPPTAAAMTENLWLLKYIIKKINELNLTSKNAYHTKLKSIERNEFAM
jgi:hypothetical protein